MGSWMTRTHSKLWATQLNSWTYGIIGNLVAPVYGFRNMGVNMFEQYHNNRHAYVF